MQLNGKMNIIPGLNHLHLNQDVGILEIRLCKGRLKCWSATYPPTVEVLERC